MNLYRLEAFRVVYETGSFTRAAAVLHISQPAVSKLVAQLERDCAFVLFHRRKNAVVPTSEGALLYAEAKRLFVDTRLLDERAQAIRDAKTGTLRIVAFPSLASHVLPEILTRFIREHADIQVSLVTRTSFLLVEYVSAQNVDMGFGLVDAARPGVRFEPFVSMCAVCVLPATHRLAGKQCIHPADLADEPYVSINAEDRVQASIDRVFDYYRVPRRIVAEAQQTIACCSFVAAELGVTIVDPLSTVGFASDRLVVRPFRPKITFEISLALPEFRPPSLLASEFLSFARKELTDVIASFP